MQTPMTNNLLTPQHSIPTFQKIRDGEEQVHADLPGIVKPLEDQGNNLEQSPPTR